MKDQIISFETAKLAKEKGLVERPDHLIEKSMIFVMVVIVLDMEHILNQIQDYLDLDGLEILLKDNFI